SQTDTLVMSDRLLLKPVTTPRASFWVKFDSTLQLTDAHMLSTTGSGWNYQVKDLASDKLGNAYLYGVFHQDLIIGLDTVKARQADPPRDADTYLLKLDRLGNLRWAQVGVTMNKLTLNASDQLVIVGNPKGAALVGSQTIQGGYYLSCLDSLGEPLWIFR
ncbi:MAG: hypothetical protein AAF804_10695, partial [Bacteroidota bacterium]